MINNQQLGDALIEVFDDGDVPEGTPYRKEYCPYYIRITNNCGTFEIYSSHDIGPEAKIHERQ